MKTVSAAAAAQRLDDPTPGHGGELYHRWGPEILVVCLVGLVLPMAVAIHYGSISAPAADDWSYDLSAFHLAYHGSINLYHWGTINLIGQLVLAVPVIWIFGPHIWVLNTWTCVIGAAGLVAVDYLGRSLGLSRRHALFAAVLMGAGPMWAVLATSFMTEIQSFSFMTIALAVAASDTRIDKIVTPRAVIALALAGFAFTIREPTGVAFAAIAICRLGRCGRPDRRSTLRWAAIVGVLGAALFLFYVWRRALPSGGYENPPHWGLYNLPSWWYRQWLFPLLGLSMAPIAALIGPFRTVRLALTTCRTKVILAWMVMPILPITRYIAADLQFAALGGSHRRLAIIYEIPPSFGNSFFNPAGFSDTGPNDFSRRLTWVLALVAVVSTLVVVAAIVLGVRRWASRPRHPRETPPQAHYVAVMLALVTAGSVLAWLLLVSSGLYMWDRYLLPGVMSAALLLLYLAAQIRSESHERTRASLHGPIVLAGLAVISLVVTSADDGFIGSQWRYSNQVAALLSPTPARLIYTNWTWSSTQNKRMVAESPSYRPCYSENLDAPALPGNFARVRGGSWAHPDSYSMSISPQAQHDQDCRQAGRLSPTEAAK